MLVIRKTFAAGALAAVGLMAGPRQAQAQDYVHDRSRYTLTMPSAWDSVAVPAGQAAGADLSILAKAGGINGLAYITCMPGTTAPNVDSLAANYTAVLGGNIAKDSSGTKTLGKYTVHWQKFTYDSLPELSDMIQAQAPFIPRLGKGSFRAYYLVSDGYVFTIAGLRVLASGPYPYADIEAGIAALVLKPQSGSIRKTIGIRKDLFIADGRIGGPWLIRNPLAAVESFGLDGSFLGSGQPDGAGAWTFPAGRKPGILVLRGIDGKSHSFLIGQSAR